MSPNEMLSIVYKGVVFNISVGAIVFRKQENNVRSYYVDFMITYDDHKKFGNISSAADYYTSSSTLVLDRLEGDCLGAFELIQDLGDPLHDELEYLIYKAIHAIPPIDPSTNTSRDTSSPYLTKTKTEPDLGEWDLL